MASTMAGTFTSGTGNAFASGGASIERGAGTRSPLPSRRSRVPNFTGESRPSHRAYCTNTWSFSP